MPSITSSQGAILFSTHFFLSGGRVVDSTSKVTHVASLKKYKMVDYFRENCRIMFAFLVPLPTSVRARACV